METEEAQFLRGISMGGEGRGVEEEREEGQRQQQHDTDT
jgi:hypothetical protein